MEDLEGLIGNVSEQTTKEPSRKVRNYVAEKLKAGKVLKPYPKIWICHIDVVDLFFFFCFHFTTAHYSVLFC